MCYNHTQIIHLVLLLPSPLSGWMYSSVFCLFALICCAIRCMLYRIFFCTTAVKCSAAPSCYIKTLDFKRVFTENRRFCCLPLKRRQEAILLVGWKTEMERHLLCLLLRCVVVVVCALRFR